MVGLAEQLYGIYSARIYPVLAHNDPIYQRSLAKAGLGWHAPEVVPAASRTSFEQEMRMQAWLAARRIEDANSLDAGSIRVKALSGRLTLYRVAQRGVATAPGIWWFTDKVARRCRDEAGPDLQKRLAWLRNVLAVCFNWSSFDRIERLALHEGESIPAVLGRGLPMPHYKADPYNDRKTGERVVTLPLDYWKRKGEMLMGGELQVVLPWVPAGRVAVTDGLP